MRVDPDILLFVIGWLIIATALALLAGCASQPDMPPATALAITHTVQGLK